MRKVLAFTIASIIYIFWGGFVAATLWGWFIAPLGAPIISTLQAAGINTVISAFLGSRGIDLKDDTPIDVKIAMSLAMAIWFPMCSLMFGGAIHLINQW